MRTFKRSADPACAEKVEDIIGLYMDAPRHAVVLSVEEKSQIQAIKRTQLDRVLVPRRPATRTHDYVRYGTTTSFAAVNALEETVIGRCMQRHRHEDIMRFFNAVAAKVPTGKVVHVVLGNYRPHSHAKVRALLSRHPRCVFHIIRTSVTWLNAVESFFSALSHRRLRRETFTGIVDLQAAIKNYTAD